VRVIGEPPTAIGYHVTMRLSDDRAARDAVCMLAHFHRHGESRAWSRFDADTHAHALVVAREEAGRFAVVGRAETPHSVAFERCRIRPIDERIRTLRYTQRRTTAPFDLARRQ
jgi:hypothetical protein